MINRIGKSYSRFLVLLLIFVFAFQGKSQTKADLQLLAEIMKIKAIDNHSHVLRVVNEGGTDEEGDAIACGGLEFVSPPPMRLRIDNPIYIGAWKMFFDYQYNDINEAHLRELMSIKKKVMQEKGDDYPSWVLDKLNIEIMLANRIKMGRGLNAPRFRWVSYGDPLLLPFSTKTIRQKNSDVNFFYSQEEKLFNRFLSELGVKKIPATFDLYLKQIVMPTLKRQKSNGAIAIKFVAAYYRSLDFDDVSENEARVIYTKYVNGGEPSSIEYKKFQDYVFRYIVREAGRLNLAVHIHTGGGCGHFFNLKTSNPILLESVINNPAFRNTKFVLIHGGYPFVNETAFLLEKPNVYADFSAQTFLLSPRALSKVIRSWIEYEPEKVLFGTDASPATPEVNWEESAWLTSQTAREALAIALTEMIEDKEVSYKRAIELARMVMRENAAQLYGLNH